PAVAVDPDHVHVARPAGDLLLEDLGALIHHWVEQALQDLLVRDEAARDTELGRDLDNDLLDVGVGNGGTVSAVLVVARACLLAKAAHLAEAVGDSRLLATSLADAPAHIEPGKVTHGKRPHREAEVVEHLVDLVWQRPREQESLRLLATLVQHAVADEAVADADEYRHLLAALAHGQCRRNGRWR